VPPHLDSGETNEGRYSLDKMMSNVERLVSDSCVIAQPNGVSADIVHRAKIANKTGREVSQRRPDTRLLVSR
jgi:hypothetical protein